MYDEETQEQFKVKQPLYGGEQEGDYCYECIVNKCNGVLVGEEYYEVDDMVICDEHLKDFRLTADSDTIDYEGKDVLFETCEVYGCKGIFYDDDYYDFDGILICEDHINLYKKVASHYTD